MAGFGDLWYSKTNNSQCDQYYTVKFFTTNEFSAVSFRYHVVSFSVAPVTDLVFPGPGIKRLPNGICWWSPCSLADQKCRFSRIRWVPYAHVSDWCGLMTAYRSYWFHERLQTSIVGRSTPVYQLISLMRAGGTRAISASLRSSLWLCGAWQWFDDIWKLSAAKRTAHDSDEWVSLFWVDTKSWSK